GIPRRLHLELASDMVLYWFSQGSKCLRRGEERHSALRDMMTLTETLMDADPSLPLQVLTFAAHQQVTAAMVGRGIPEELQGARTRMEHLMERARAQQAAR